MFEINWKGGLSVSGQDAVLDAAEYAWPRTIKGCWNQLRSMRIRGKITDTTYNEICAVVSFELADNETE